MGKFEEGRKYMHSQASQVFAKLEMSLVPFASLDREEIPHELWDQEHWATADATLIGELRAIVSKYKDDHLVAIACCGLAWEGKRTEHFTLREACMRQLDWKKSGRALLVEIALVTLVAALADLIWARLHQKPLIKCRFCDFTVAKQFKSRGDLVSGFDAISSHISKNHRQKSDAIESHLGDGEDEEADTTA
jgi:hypothetical protein